VDTGKYKHVHVESNGNGREEPRSGDPQLRVSLPPGRRSATRVRDALSEVAVGTDRVVLEQVAVLVGALTSGDENLEARPSSRFDLRLWAEPDVVKVELHDQEFARHRSEGGLVELDRSLVSGWRLKLVERLADRWSVEHDGGLTLRFEFDSEGPSRATAHGEGRRLELVPLGESRSPIGGWDFLTGNGRSGNGWAS